MKMKASSLRVLGLALLFATSTAYAVFAAGADDTTNSIVPDHPIYINGGPGIAISGSAEVSQLPDSAQTFLRKNYADDEVTKCRRDFLKGTSKVYLADGTRIEFDKNGRVDDIVSGDNQSLSEGVLNDVLPAKVVKHLRETGFLYEVSAIKNAHKNGYCVMLLNDIPPHMIFDVNGLFIETAG